MKYGFMHMTPSTLVKVQGNVHTQLPLMVEWVMNHESDGRYHYCRALDGSQTITWEFEREEDAMLFKFMVNKPGKGTGHDFLRGRDARDGHGVLVEERRVRPSPTFPGSRTRGSWNTL